jgi:thiosulfate/3-mercaptopyruvate sulfurtransferase
MFFLIPGLVIFLGLHSIRIFEPPERLRQNFENVGVVSNNQVIHYCGGGIAATTTMFALEVLRFSNSAVYDNSCSNG